MKTFSAKFGPGDLVHVDGELSEIKGIVTGVWQDLNGGVKINVAWWNHGDHKDEWFAESRLTEAKS